MTDGARADITLIGSTFGGGWAIPQTVEGELVGREVFGNPPYALFPLGNASGWIVEPQDATALLNECIRQGASVETTSGRILTEPDA